MTKNTKIAAPRAPLAFRLEEAAAAGVAPGAVRVLSAGRDPYGLDTPANHRDGEWLAMRLADIRPGGERIHLRGLHYGLLGSAKPNGQPYMNTEEDWVWMSERAAKAARWLQYVPFTALYDARNGEPECYTPTISAPEWKLTTGGVEVTLPDAADLAPRLEIVGDLGQQPVRQAIIAEKAGVADILRPVCQRRQATLLTPSGEVSDTLVYGLLAEAAEDGRPLVIHQLGDCDPAGWQMAISTARKVQGMIDLHFPGLDVTVHAIGLTPAQCSAWDLPSTPLKASEGRADRWLAHTGRQQTELDAAVIRAPAQFSKMVEKALLAHYDTTVGNRAADTKRRLEEEENLRLAAKIGPETLARLHAEAAPALELIREQIEALTRLAVDAEAVGIEVPEDPEPVVGEAAGLAEPLFTTGDDWIEASRRLRARKDY